MRETIRLPNSNYYNVWEGAPSGGLFHVPPGASIFDNDLTRNGKSANQLNITQRIGDQSIANSNITFPLLEKNLEFQLNMNFGPNNLWSTDRGMAIVLHGNGPDQLPGGGYDGYGQRLAVYGNSKNNPEIRNAIAIEFDMQNNRNMYDPNLPVSGSHIAITQPITPDNNALTVRHDAISAYAEASIMNDEEHRVIVNWEHLSSGADLIENTADDIYVLRYRVFAGPTPMEGETAVASGSQQYTRQQALDIFKTEDITLSVTGSSSTAITSYIAFPESYDYTIQYMIQNKEGVPTETPFRTLSQVSHCQKGDR